MENLEETFEEKKTDLPEQTTEISENVEPVEQGNTTDSNDEDVEELITEKPDFLLEQFESIEDQAKSYKDLQSDYTRKTQRLSELEKQLQEYQQSQVSNQKYNELNTQYQTINSKLDNEYFEALNTIDEAYQSGQLSDLQKDAYVKRIDYDYQVKKNTLLQEHQKLLQNIQTPVETVEIGEFFDNDEEFKSRAYLAKVKDFLKENYGKLPKSELEGIKNTIKYLEKSIREDIEKQYLNKEGEEYRKKLSSASDLSKSKGTQKVFTRSEINSMTPEEYNKNKNAILKQMAEGKITKEK